MKKNTIAQLRYQNAANMANTYGMDYEQAAHISNAYYRLCGLCERRLEFDNDARRYNEKESDRLAKEERAATDRLSDKLAPFGLVVSYYGYLPTIEEQGTQRRVFSAHFYN